MLSTRAHVGLGLGIQLAVAAGLTWLLFFGPDDLQVRAYYGVPLVFASMFVAVLAYLAIVPATCGKCGRSAKGVLGLNASLDEDPSRGVKKPMVVRYTCASCGHVERRAWGS